MNGKDLLYGLSFIDDELVQEAAQEIVQGALQVTELNKAGRKKSAIKFLVPIAASFAVAVTIFLLWTDHQTAPPFLSNDNNILPNESEQTPYDNPQYTLNFNHTDIEIAYNLYIKGHFWEELSCEQIDIILPIISKKHQVDGTINYSHSDGNITIFSIDTIVKIKKNQNVKITISPDEVAKCYIIDGESILSDIEGITVEAGIFTGTNNGNVIYYADFKIDNVAYYVEFAGDKEEEAFFTNIVADIILGGKADLSIFNPIAPELRDDNLTEEEAYTEADYGKYLLKVPNNYQFNDAVRFINQSSNFLLASWSHGYDDIRITISRLSEDDKNRIISVNDTTLYDMALYHIPWSESIPRDICDIVENPIFKIEELSLDAVKMREYTRNEKGDTNSINMTFSVLYGDIVVDVSTEGISSEYLFKELTSLP